MGKYLDSLKGKETAFDCPLIRIKYGENKKVNILEACMGWCGESSWHYRNGGPTIYCPMDGMGEREVETGKITRDN